MKTIIQRYSKFVRRWNKVYDTLFELKKKRFPVTRCRMNESMKYVYDVLHKCYFGNEINAANVHSCKKNLVACTVWTNILASHLWFLYVISWPPPHYHQNVSPIYICIVFICFYASVIFPPLQKFSWVDWDIIVSKKLIRVSNHVHCLFVEGDQIGIAASIYYCKFYNRSESVRYI